MIITIASSSEGVGKSVLATNIAALRALVERKVLLIDIDPKKSSFVWSEKRRVEGIQPQIQACSVKGKDLKLAIEQFTGGFNDVVIDTDWRNSKGSQYALEVAEMVVVPVRPGTGSLDDIKLTMRRIKAARISNPDLWVLFVISRAKGMVPIQELDAIRHYIAKVPSAALAGTMIQERSIVQIAFAESLSIFEYKPADPQAIAEMLDLYRAQKLRRAGVPSLERLQRHARP